MDQIKIFAPATVANVSCGFDALGFALEALGDAMVFKKTVSKVVKITKIEGADLPFDVNKNVVGVVAQQILNDANADFGLEIEVYKNFKPGSGLGSSAASSAGTAYAVNQLLGMPFSKLELTKYAMQGEVAACGSAIADNVAAAIYGGFILVRSYEPLDIVSLPTPNDLFVSVIHPQIEIRTEDARRVLPKSIPLKTAIAQWANVGGLVSGLYESNYETIGNSLIDMVAEPARKQFIPHFDELKTACLNTGALGFGISGSGPSMFALSEGKDIAQNVANAMTEVYQKTGIDFKVYISAIHKNGVEEM